MKIKARIPTSLSDVTVEQYQNWLAVAEKEGQSEAFLDEKLIQYMTGLDQIVITKLKRKDYREILAKIKTMMDQTPEFVQTFTMDGIPYGFIPHFERDVLFKEWVDLDLYMQNWSTMHKALGILYRPITEQVNDRYTIREYDHKDDTEHFKKLPLDIALGATLFFWTLAKQLLAVTPKSLESKLKENPQVMAMLENGDGTRSYIPLLREISLDGMKLLPSHWGPHYYGLLMSGTTKKKLKEELTEQKQV